MCVVGGGVIVAHNGQKGMLGFVEVGICQLPGVGAQTGTLVLWLLQEVLLTTQFTTLAPLQHIVLFIFGFSR